MLLPLLRKKQVIFVDEKPSKFPMSGAVQQAGYCAADFHPRTIWRYKPSNSWSLLVP